MLNVAEEAGVKPRGYQLQKALELLPSQLNQENEHRKTKWDRYFYFKDKTPSEDTLTEIQKRFKRSNDILTLPLWALFDFKLHSHDLVYDMLLKMPSNIKRHLFQLHSPYVIKREISSRAIEAIERIGTEHALACLIGLEVNKDFYLYPNKHIKGAIMRLLKRCCLIPPLNKIKAELYDEIVKYIIAPNDTPNDSMILESRECFLTEVSNLKIIYRFLQELHITEEKINELELSYWLVKGNISEIIEDCRRINNKLPLIKKEDGLLWVFESMMFQSKGLMKDRLTFLYAFYLKGDYSKNQR